MNNLRLISILGFSFLILAVSISTSAQQTSSSTAQIVLAESPVNTLYFNINATIAPKRTITGFVFDDEDGDGQFKPGKDKPIEGASISVNGIFARSDGNGRYVLQDLPTGRIGLLVRWPNGNESTQVVLYLDPGPVTDRVVNIPRSR